MKNGNMALKFRRDGGEAAGLRLQHVDPLQEGADRDLGGGAAAEGADEAGLSGSGGGGGEKLEMPRWGGAPTMALPLIIFMSMILVCLCNSEMWDLIC